MSYFAHINSHDELTDMDMSILKIDEYGSTNVQNIEVSEKVYKNQDQYIYKNGKIVKNPNYNAEQLEKAKNEKYAEANKKAEDYLANIALFELYPDFHVEATQNHITMFATASNAIEKGIIPYQEWTSKEDNKRQLDDAECMAVSLGISQIHSDVWNEQYLAYKTSIDNASTVEEVERITINYVN